MFDYLKVQVKQEVKQEVKQFDDQSSIWIVYKKMQEQKTSWQSWHVIIVSDLFHRAWLPSPLLLRFISDCLPIFAK